MMMNNISTSGSLTLLVLADIQTSLNQFLNPEILSSQNKWFCPSCKALSESSREICVINSVPIFVIQLCWFSNQDGRLVKFENFFSCTQIRSNKDLTVPIAIEEEIATIIEAFWTWGITGLLSRISIVLCGTLPMEAGF